MSSKIIDTLKLGNNWYYEEGNFPLLKKLNISGTTSNDLIIDQEKTALN